jgi:hypothetical protein
MTASNTTLNKEINLSSIKPSDLILVVLFFSIVINLVLSLTLGFLSINNLLKPKAPVEAETMLNQRLIDSAIFLIKNQTVDNIPQ